jgi:CubicO group peptidase (beta-lactamase class C family)
MKLFEEKKLDFNDLVIKYLPLFPYKNVTVSELLSHTSVLPDYANFITMEKREFIKKSSNTDLHKLSEVELNYFTNEDILQYIINYSPSPVSNSKKEFIYCNTNYVILAIIIERITNMDYPSVLKKYIFDKYGLNNTFVFNKNNIEKYIPSYKENNEIWGIEKFDLIYGDKNIYSTAIDLYLWDNILKSTAFLKKETTSYAYEPKSILTKENKTYGYGWRLVFPENQEKIIYHNGWWHGNNTALIRLIEKNAVIIILGNRYNDYIYSHKRFVEILRNMN